MTCSVLPQADLILEGVLNGQRYLEIWLRKLEVRNGLSVSLAIAILFSNCLLLKCKSMIQQNCNKIEYAIMCCVVCGV